MSVGFKLQDVPATEPRPGSIEHTLDTSGCAGEATITSLDDAPTDADGAGLLGSIRTQSTSMLTDLATAFDAVISVPTVTRDRTVTF